MEKNKLILIGMPNGSGSVPASMVSSLLQLHKPCPCAFMIVERQMIELARNAIVLEGLKNNVTHILMVDDDNPIPPDTLEKMVEDDKDIVIAPILSRNPNAKGVHDLCAFYSMEVEGIKLYKNIEQFKDDGYLHKIDGGGTGCILIKIEVLAKLFSIYKDRIFERTRDVFEKPITVDGKEYIERTMSEDVQFCERAVEAGFEVWLDSRIKPLHITGNNYVKYGTV
jgi:hypothetical protein